MKKLKRIILVCLIVLIFPIVLFLLAFIGEDKNKTLHLIHYYHSNNLYDIYIREKNIYIEKYDVVICFQAPCEAIRSSSYTIKYKDDYYEIINEIFYNSNEFEIAVSDGDLSYDKVAKLNNMVMNK